MSIAVMNRIAELEQRVDALEAELIAWRITDVPAAPVDFRPVAPKRKPGRPKKDETLDA